MAQLVKNPEGIFVEYTCSCWNLNPEASNEHHNGRCTKFYECIRTRENDPFPTKFGRHHKTYCIRKDKK